MHLGVTRDALGALERSLAGLPLAGSNLVERNLRFQRELAQPEPVLALLETLLDDQEAVERVARRSYRHVNHFDKILLIDSVHNRGYRLTLHMWKPPYAPGEVDDELIHDHRFSFWSSVLVGQLASENFDWSAADGREYRQYRYVPEKPTSVTTANFYEFVGQATLTEPWLTTKLAGNTYYLYSERIHRVLLPLDGMTCTLVLRGPRERGYSNIFNTSYPSYDLKTSNRPFNPDELRGKLADLAGELRRRVADSG